MLLYLLIFTSKSRVCFLGFNTLEDLVLNMAATIGIGWSWSPVVNTWFPSLLKVKQNSLSFNINSLILSEVGKGKEVQDTGLQVHLSVCRQAKSLPSSHRLQYISLLGSFVFLLRFWVNFYLYEISWGGGGDRGSKSWCAQFL